jgi:hypothetical protein
MYEKSSSVTFGGYALLPNGENREVEPPQNERPQPLIETAAVVKRTNIADASAEGGTESRWVDL